MQKNLATLSIIYMIPLLSYNGRKRSWIIYLQLFLMLSCLLYLHAYISTFLVWIITHRHMKNTHAYYEHAL